MITLEKVLTELKGETLNEIIGGTYRCNSKSYSRSKSRSKHKNKCKKDKKPKGCKRPPSCVPNPCGY